MADDSRIHLRDCSDLNVRYLQITSRRTTLSVRAVTELRVRRSVGFILSPHSLTESTLCHRRFELEGQGWGGTL